MRALIAIAASASIAVAAEAQPRFSVRLVPNLNEWNGQIPFRGCEFFDDSLTIVVAEAGRDVMRRDVCSSYGKARVRVVSDAQGDSFMLFESLAGRGPNAWTDYLVVFRLTDHLAERARLEMSEAAGPTSRWRYAYRIERPPSGGLVLRLRLTSEGNGEIETPSLEKSKVVHIQQ